MFDISAPQTKNWTCVKADALPAIERNIHLLKLDESPAGEVARQPAFSGRAGLPVQCVTIEECDE
jgi:hypothetical protein